MPNIFIMKFSSPLLDPPEKELSREQSVVQVLGQVAPGLAPQVAPNWLSGRSVDLWSRPWAPRTSLARL